MYCKIRRIVFNGISKRLLLLQERDFYPARFGAVLVPARHRGTPRRRTWDFAYSAYGCRGNGVFYFIIFDNAIFHRVNNHHASSFHPPLRTMLSGGKSRTPVSEAIATIPSSVTRNRAGRRPLRSSAVPIKVSVGERNCRHLSPWSKVCCDIDRKRVVSLISAFASHASGTSIIRASGTERPLRTKSSRALSRMAESEPLSVIMA